MFLMQVFAFYETGSDLGSIASSEGATLQNTSDEQAVEAHMEWG